MFHPNEKDDGDSHDNVNIHQTTLWFWTMSISMEYSGNCKKIYPYSKIEDNVSICPYSKIENLTVFWTNDIKDNVNIQKLKESLIS